MINVKQNQKSTDQVNNLYTKAEEVFTYPDVKRAFDLAELLESWAKTHQSMLAEEEADTLQSILSRLQFIALPLMPVTKVVNLFQEHLKEALDLDIDFIEQVRHLLIVFPTEDRDEIKIRISGALEQNQQRITRVQPVAQGSEGLPSTLAEWIKHYFSFMQGRMSDRLREVEFFTKSPAMLAISSEERDKIKKIFILYRFLHSSSVTPEGFEESIIIRDKNGELKVLQNGSLEPVKKTTWPNIRTGSSSKSSRVLIDVPTAPYPAKHLAESRSPLDRLKDKYNTYRRSRADLLRLEDQLLVKTKGDVELVKKDFATAVRKSDRDTVIACLMIMARHGALQTALRDNPAWFTAVSEYIQKKYSSRYPAEDITYALSNIKLEPMAPAAVSEFLQYILLEKVRLPADDAALVGVEIGQVLGEQYQSIAYGNQETGHFEWSRNKIVDRRLVGEM